MATQTMQQFYFARLLQYFERLKEIHGSLFVDKLTNPFHLWEDHVESNWIHIQEYSYKAVVEGASEDLVRRYYEVAERMYMQIYTDVINNHLV